MDTWNNNAICNFICILDGLKKRSGINLFLLQTNNMRNTHKMKALKTLNFEFKIRDIEATTLRHQSRVNKLQNSMKAKGIDFDDILNVDELHEMNQYDLVSKNWYRWSEWILKEYLKTGLTQKLLKEIKSLINGSTYNLIQANLIQNDIPKSYTTAFYAHFYKKVNSMMIESTKSLIINCL